MWLTYQITEKLSAFKSVFYIRLFNICVNIQETIHALVINCYSKMHLNEVTRPFTSIISALVNCALLRGIVYYASDLLLCVFISCLDAFIYLPSEQLVSQL